jgi:hypothetical protein
VEWDFREGTPVQFVTAGSLRRWRNGPFPCVDTGELFLSPQAQSQVWLPLFYDVSCGQSKVKPVNIQVDHTLLHKHGQMQPLTYKGEGASAKEEVLFRTASM